MITKCLSISLVGACCVTGCGLVRTQRVAYGPTAKPAGTAVAKLGQPVSAKAPAPQVAQLGDPVSQPQPEIVQTSASEPVPEPPTPTAATSTMTPAVDTSLPPGAVVEETDPRPPRSGFARGEDAPPRRSYIDITASSCYAHADDYSWLRGEVEYSRISKGWRLRYASVDEDDKYGGSVTLSGDTEKLKDGMHVVVKGQMHDPEARGISPLYHADSIQTVEKKD
jgi:hypothetical protein